MTEVVQTLSLHPETVSDADEHAAAYNPGRERATETRPRTSRVRSLRVHPDVMAAAKKLLAERPGSRLVIVSETEVRIE